MSFLKRIPLHPFLFSTYAVLSMLAYNIVQVKPVRAVRSLIVFLIGTLVLLLLTRLMVRNWHKAAFLSSIIVVLFFSYGHVYNLIEGEQIFGVFIGRHRYLILLWSGLLLIGTRWVLKSRREPALAQALNSIAILALLFPLTQIMIFEFKPPVTTDDEVGSSSIELQLPTITNDLQVPEGEIPPDIYYIILDMYVRDDVLRDTFNFDNSAFMNFLNDMGFYIARCSVCNYEGTPLSLASSLNMNYLEAFGEELIKTNADPYQSGPYIHNNLVSRELKKLDYKIVNVESGFFLTEWADADIYISGESESPGRILAFGGMNTFESMLLQSTMGMLINENRSILPEAILPYLDQPYIERRERILFALESLENITDIPGPKFVFVHFVVPHPPFVFGPNGEFVVRNTPLTLNYDFEDRDWNRYVPGYTGQVTFLNNRFMQILGKILVDSTTPPIIIIQGDHGITRVQSERDRSAILNAYYLPDGGNKLLYPTISPVNSFRLIFDTYFGGDLGLLEDITYLQEPGKGQYDFEDIPSTRIDCSED